MKGNGLGGVTVLARSSVRWHIAAPNAFELVSGHHILMSDGGNVQ